MTAARSAELLGGVGTFTVVGEGQAAETAADILRALGGSVRRLAQPIGSTGVGPLDEPSVVICDLVSDGCDPSYVAEVSRRPHGAWVTISAFGLDGPQGGRPGSDLIGAAAGGLLSAVADPDGHLYPMPGNQSLKVAGQAAALAALQAISLLADGSGPLHLDLSVQEAVAFSSVQQECAHLVYECGVIAGVSRYSAPSGVFPCADGQIGVIVIDDHQFARFSETIDRPDFISIFPTLSDRVQFADMINSVCAEWTSSRSKFLCEQLLQERGVAGVAVRTLAEIEETDQYRARNFLLPDDAGTLRTELLPALVDTGRAVSDAGERRRSLRGLRVAEATNVLAGPLTGAILGAIGATVVRLEDKERLDIYRRNGPFKSGQAGQERAAYYLFANYSKRSICQGIGEDQGYGRRVGEWADAVMENVGAGRLRRTGLAGPEETVGQGRSFLSISGFGRTGPCADYKGYGPNVHAFAGLAGAVIEQSSPEVTIRTSFADYCSAMWAATLLSAWWLGGSPARVFDLSMAEVITSKLIGCPIGPSAAGQSGEVTDVLVRCSDRGHVALLIRAPVDRSVLLGLLGVDEESVRRSRSAGVEIWEVSVDGPDTPEVLERADKAGIPAAMAEGLVQLLEDKQLLFRGFLVHQPHPEVETAAFFGLPWKIAGAKRSGYRRPPLLGEDDQWMETELAKSVPTPSAKGGQA